MPNPIPYKDLFDVDGLKLAVKELTAETDAYGVAATEDFKRVNNVVAALKKELEGLSVTLSKPIKLMEDSGQSQVKEYATQISELTKQVKTQQAAIEAMNKVMTEQKQVIMDAKAATAEYARDLAKEKVATQEARTEIAKKTLELKELALNTKSATAAQVAATGSYKEAVNKLKEMRIAILGAEGAFENMTPEIKKQIADYDILNNRIKEFDAKMGNFQRNVGNYKSGFNGLNNSINQISRELPAFTFSMQTGFLALSNNIPILADNIKQTKDRIAELRKEGQEVPSLFKQIVSGIFSWQTLLSVGITLVTVYGKEIGIFFKELFKGRDIIDTTKLALQDLNKAFASGEYSTAIKQTYELTSNIKAAQQGYMDKTEVLNQYNSTLGRTIGFANDLNEAEKLMRDNTQAYINSTLAKAAANAALEEAIKKQTEIQAAQETGAIVSSMDRTKSYLTRFFTLMTSFSSKSQAAQDLVKGEQASAAKRQTNLITDLTKEFEAQLKLYNKYFDDYKKSLLQFKGTNKQLTDDQLTSIEQLKQRIAELSKLPGSAIDGSAINNRIDVLKARLKELNDQADKTAKEGFALLEEQLSKLSVEMQKAIINDYAAYQGKESQSTKKLADEYINLTDKIKKLKEAQDEAQRSAQRRADFNNRGNAPVLGSASNVGTLDAAGLSSALNHSALITELDKTQGFLSEIQDAYANTNKVIFQQYKDRKITLSQYNQQIQTAQDSAADDIFEQEKKAAELRIKLAETEYGIGSKEYRSATKSLGDLQDKYNKESLSRDERMYAAKLKLQQETIVALQRGAQALAKYTNNSGLGSLFGDISTNLVNGIGDGERFQKIAEMGMDAIGAYTEFAINASNIRIDQLNKERDHDLSLAGNNAEAKAKIEEEYNQKVTAEKRKQATLQKAAAIADIAINTAVAVTKVAAVTGPLAFLLAPAIIALGAIEAGIVLATPLPQYAKGRNGGNAELAEVNERGPELIGQRGKWRLANRGMRGVTYLNQGDQVKTATDTKQMLANGMITADGQYVTNVSQSKSIYDQYIMATNKASNIDYGMMAGAVANGVSGLPVTEHNWNERGYQQNVRTKNTRILDINRRNRF